MSLCVILTHLWAMGEIYKIIANYPILFVFKGVSIDEEGAVWFRQKTLPVHQITQGDSYRRSRPFNVVETAKIIDVDTDNFGISHVRFTVQVTGPITMDEEQRTLSVESFRNLYPEPLMA